MEATVTIKASLEEVDLLCKGMVFYRDMQGEIAKTTSTDMKAKQYAREQAAQTELLLEKLNSGYLRRRK